MNIFSKIVLTLSATFLLSGFTFADLPDSTQNQNKERREKEKIVNQNKETGDAPDNKVGGLKEQQDKDGNLQTKESKKDKRKKDVFVDKDGDGISDNRASGMSFNKLRKRTRAGGEGSGGGSGSGGGGHNGNGSPGGKN